MGTGNGMGAAVWRPVRHWLRSDMKVLRWFFLGFYLLLCVDLIRLCGDLVLIPIVCAVYFGSQALFVFGAGTTRLCEPIEPGRLWIPVAITAYALAQLAAWGGLVLMVLWHCPWPAKVPIHYLTSGLNLGAWPLCGVLLWFLVRKRERRSALARLVGILLVCGIMDIARTVASRRAFLSTWIGPKPTSLMQDIVSDAVYLLPALGPMLVLLFLRLRYRRELAQRVTSSCPACGYDLRGTLAAGIHTCPECGAQAPADAVALPLT